MKTTAPVHTLPPTNRGEAVKKLLPLLLTYQEGKPVNVRISIARPERTPPQLRYLWGVVMTMLSEHAGYEKDDIHEYLCGSFFGWKPKRLPGNRAEQIPMRSTTVDEDGNRDVIDGDDFWRYVDFCQRFGARHGVVIPDPDPSYKLTRTK